MIALLSGALTAAVVLFAKMLKWRDRYLRLRSSLMERERISNKAVDTVMEIYFSLLTVGAMHGTGGEPMRREMKRLLIVNPEEEGNMLNGICSLADSRYYGIITHLRKTYPQLNDNDLKLCSLLCFKPEAVGIMALYNHNNQACYYNKRWRVMRRMDLPKGKYNLEKFLDETVKELSEKCLTLQNKD